MTPPQPQTLRSNTVNPANLVELQVLENVVAQLQSKNDIKGSIPYIAKIVQILANQKLDRPQPQDGEGKKQHYYQQLNQLQKVQAEAYAQLADAYFRTQQFILCESNLLLSVKIWEKLVRHDPASVDFAKQQLCDAYGQLFEAYEAMGKTQLAQHAKAKQERLTSTT